MIRPNWSCCLLLVVLLALGCQRGAVPGAGTAPKTPATSQEPQEQPEYTGDEAMEPRDNPAVGADTPNRNTAAAAAAKSAAAATQPVVELRKTPCYGNCPTFTFQVFADGRAVYEGRANVDRLGRYTAQLTKEEVNDLVQTAVRGGFFQLRDEYPGNQRSIPDLPNTDITITYAGQTKKVVNNHDAPKALMDYEALLLEKIEGIRWARAGNSN